MDVTIKLIKCRSCKKDFEPIYRNGIIKSRLCLSCLIGKAKHKVKKDKAKEREAVKDKLKTHSEWLNDLQKVFNTYIRLRDKGKPCISCGAIYGEYTPTAGHYFSVGSSPNLRFNEDNVHGQCWYNCNKNKHGNIAEYTPNLIEKIGVDRYNILLNNRNKPLMLSIHEIQNLMIVYKDKIKKMQDD